MLKNNNTGRDDGVFTTIGSTFSSGRGVLGMEGRRGFIGVYHHYLNYITSKHTE